jgi:hypothetical protein
MHYYVPIEKRLLELLERKSKKRNVKKRSALQERNVLKQLELKEKKENQ